MSKGWRVILWIFLAAVLLGAVFCGVGFLTGAETGRIILGLNEHYRLNMYIDAVVSYAGQFLRQLSALL